MAISILLQPTPYQSGHTYSRSPLIYRFSGCTQSNTYDINVYLKKVTTPGSADIYVTISRKPDEYGVILIDTSTFVKNFLDEDYSYAGNNSTLSIISLLEYSGSTSLVSTTNSYASYVTMGYSTIGFGLNDINYVSTNKEINYSLNTESMLSSIAPDSTTQIYLPLTGTTVIESFNLYYRRINATRYILTFKGINGSFGQSIYTWSAISRGDSVTEMAPITINTQYYPLIDYSYPIKLEVFNNTTLNNTYYFQVDNQCVDINDMTVISFVNKFGVLDTMYFAGRAEEQLSVTSDTYKFNRVNYDSSTYWDKKSYHKMNINGKNSYSVNTGWFSENNNNRLKDMFLSERVFFRKPYFNGSTTEFVNTPVIITDSSIKYKTEKYDKLYNYTIIFEEAFDKINRII